ncbi:MAG: ABC transporter ATP-binding protein/permease [Chitinophagaceae bacterium]|nr:ABC transporter ATP-binding protein/permease [Chitinophagaceae bacterium]
MLGFFAKNSEHYRQSAIGLAKVEAIYFPSITLLIGLSTLVTIMIGGLYHINNPERIGLDTIVEFVMYVNMLTFPVSAIGLTASMIQRAAASQKRINAFLDTEPEIKNTPASKPFVFKEEIKFENIEFTYPDTGIKAMTEFNLSIKKGEKIAVVGRTGSGKTTLAQVLLRMFDPQQGKVTIDGVDLRGYNLNSLRAAMSYVPQDVFLFSDTVHNNIAFGLNSADRDDVEAAARKACVHDDILGFAQGYETMIGERGVTLSGGQKQRISIARALIKEPDLVIFDDCLSAVDARTEKEIIGNLRVYLRDRTSIIITHRIFALMEFDKIIVLDHGKIVEQGTHNELLALGGYYATLYAKQQESE